MGILSKFLLEKGYHVHGTVRRSSTFNTSRIEPLIAEYSQDNKLNLHYSDLLDSSSLNNLISNTNPDEIYNLAAQSHVAVSFKNPVFTTQTGTLGSVSILEAVRNLDNDCKFYQASSSELFGKIQEKKQSEKTPFYPLSPYAVSKLFAFWITKNYRESFGIYACNGILFNHESPIRGETFVSRKITRDLSRIKVGLDDCLYLGNLNALRDYNSLYGT